MGMGHHTHIRIPYLFDVHTLHFARSAPYDTCSALPRKTRSPRLQALRAPSAPPGGDDPEGGVVLAAAAAVVLRPLPCAPRAVRARGACVAREEVTATAVRGGTAGADLLGLPVPGWKSTGPPPPALLVRRLAVAGVQAVEVGAAGEALGDVLGAVDDEGIGAVLADATLIAGVTMAFVAVDEAIRAGAKGGAAHVVGRV